MHVYKYVTPCTCIASCVIDFRSFPWLDKFTSWYSQVFSLWEVFPFLIWSLVPRQYFVKELESGWTNLLSLFMASLLTLLSQKLRGFISGQSMLLLGSLVEEGFSKHPWYCPKASWLQTRYWGWEKLCRTYVQASSVTRFHYFDVIAIGFRLLSFFRFCFLYWLS